MWSRCHDTLGKMTETRLRACGHCHRHFRVTEAICPFCAASGKLTTREEPSVSRRLSRAQWFALTSSLALAGCVESGAARETSDDSGSAVARAQSCDANCFTCAWPSPQGEILPPAVSCVRHSQYCAGDYSYSCMALDAGPFAPRFAQAEASCRTRPTCACLGLDGPPSPSGIECTVPDHECEYVGCSDDDAGGVSLQYHVPCYGAPPPRIG